MVKIFRKIRQNLLPENNVSKYLLYAIGEIVLVVIGILIALSINNRSELNKERKTALVYLNSLQQEFLFNLDLLEKTINEAEELSNGAIDMLIFFNPKVIDTVTEASISDAFSRLNNETIYNPSNGALLEIISSGNLKLLRNTELKQRLASFEKRVERIRVQEDEALRLRAEMEEFVRRKGSISALASLDLSSIIGIKYHEADSNKPIFESTYFLNTITFYGLVVKAAVRSYYLPLKDDIKRILTLLEEEIELQS